MQMLLKFASDRLNSDELQHFQAQIVIFEEKLQKFHGKSYCRNGQKSVNSPEYNLGWNWSFEVSRNSVYRSFMIFRQSFVG